MSDFYEGEYIVYVNGDKFELGRITSIRDDGAFVCYHEGETAAKTPFDCMHKLMNQHVINITSLGGNRFDSYNSDVCSACHNNPANGGSGVCNCILGSAPITC